MNPQKEFAQEYKLAVVDAAESVVNKIISTARQKDYEPDIFLEDVIRLARKIANQED